MRQGNREFSEITNIHYTNVGNYQKYAIFKRISTFQRIQLCLTRVIHYTGYRYFEKLKIIVI